MTVNDIINAVNRVVINPLIVLLFTIAFLMFVYGIVRFIANMDNEEERESGKRAIVWGLVGMLVMLSVFAIIRLVLGMVGLGTARLPF
jgi:uncharacterized membrane protein YidH (DUF202 family)